MYTNITLAFTLLSLHWSLTCVFAEPRSTEATTTQERPSSGLVIGIDGRVLVSPGSSHQTQELRAGDSLRSGDEIHVSVGSRVEVLWNKRALFSLQEGTGIRLLEPIGGQMLVQVLEGHARIAYAYNEGRPTDTFAVITPETRTIMRGGIVEVIAGSATPLIGNRPLIAFEGKEARAGEKGAGDVLQMVEGQASIESRSSPAKPLLLKAGYEVRVVLGTPDIPRESKSENRQRLATVESHQDVPQPAVQRIVGIHTDHALELEKGLRKATADHHDDENPGSEVTGVILSTSLGIPVTPFQGSNALSLSGSTAPVNPVVAVSPSVQTPSVVAPTAPTVASLIPSQSGGINSSSLLQEVLKSGLSTPKK